MSVEDTLEAINKQLENHEKRLKELETLLKDKPKSETTTKGLSIKEFIMSKKPKDDVQKTLAIGYFLEQKQDYTSFNVKDIESGFRASKEKVPINIPDKIQKNLKKGHMMEAKEKKDKIKACVLTISGEKYVENNFQKED